MPDRHRRHQSSCCIVAHRPCSCRRNTSSSAFSRVPLLTDRAALVVHVEHQLGGLLERVAEHLLEHERDVAHQVDRVVPDEHDPRPVGVERGRRSSARRARPATGAGDMPQSAAGRRVPRGPWSVGSWSALRCGRTMARWPSALAPSSRPGSRRVGSSTDRCVDPPPALGGFVALDQAARRRAAADDDGADDGAGRARGGRRRGWSSSRCVGGTLRRRRRQRDQHGRRPRHRRADDAHRRAARSSPA